MIHPRLILIRGLPGSGKTTIAKSFTMIGYKHFEADMCFEIDGQYKYVAKEVPFAHEWCKQMTRDALRCGEYVVVSNTFVQLRELEPYFKMISTERIKVISASGNWENVHQIPVEKLDLMRQRWEYFPACAPVVYGMSNQRN